MSEVRWRAARPPDIVMRADAAWIAGLVEGEGSFYLAEHARYPKVIFQLNMTDEDVVRRAYVLSGQVGNVRDHQPGPRSVKPQWRWRIMAQAEVAWFMDLMYPWMGIRRRGKIDELRPYLPEWARRAA